MATLLVVSSNDIASVRLGESLLKTVSWDKLDNRNQLEVYCSGTHYLWWKKGTAIFDNHVDLRFFEATGITPDEVLFLSRHSAASGKPCLTVHPIGVLDKSTSPLKYGGLSGYCPPPSPTFSAWLNLLDGIAELDGIPEGFSTSAEATHHGPVLNTPSLFIEVGSTELEWNNPIPALFWARVLTIGFGMLEHSNKRVRILSQRVREIPQWPVIIGIGGGHYAVRHRAVVAEKAVLLGHIVPNWCFGESLADGTFEQKHLHSVIESVIKSTKIAHPERELLAHIDRKSLKAPARNQLLEVIRSFGIKVVRSKELSLPPNSNLYS